MERAGPQQTAAKASKTYSHLNINNKQTLLQMNANVTPELLNV